MPIRHVDLNKIIYKTIDQEMTEAMLPPRGPDSPAERRLKEADRIKSFVVECITVSEEYRDRFRPTWEEIEKQIRQEPPEGWSKKEDWQSKVYLGLQAKTAETAFANMSAMLFPSDRFYEIRGVETRDRELEGNLETLIQNILYRGGFYQEKDFMLEESTDLGTSFLKILSRKNKDGIDFVWRSCFDCLVDPQARHKWEQSKYWVDQYKKDISYVINEINRGTASLYPNDFLRNAIAAVAGKSAGLKEEALAVVRSIDGTADMRIPKDYKSVTLNEFWGLVPMPIDEADEKKGYRLKPMVVTIINKEFILRWESNPYQVIPAIPLRIKPRKYDVYGKGYLINGRGTQDLINSMVNLGFDSMKITSFDIAMVDQNKIADPASIQYKPLALWLLKGDPRAAALLTRQSNGQSAMDGILNGIGLLDRMHQDVTGVTRHAEGSPTVDGKEGDQTLGEYRLKLQAVDKRFLSVAKRCEEDFVKPLIKMCFLIVRDKTLFSQEAITRILGKKPIMVKDPATGQEIQTDEMPKLLQEQISMKDDSAFDFLGSGVTQFSERQKTLEKLLQALQLALAQPTLTAMTNIDVLWKRIFQTSEIPDWEEIIKDKEQMRQMMEFIQALQGGIPGDGTQTGQLGPPAGVPIAA